ncbi:hypothetical protein UR08_11440 [Listeria kieliensis]|uniref:O-antigen ligase-related domain-containing protein n=2 Tax=Listeria kieliensis TaxID=1621700 RepID=A0A3D8TLP3_9LIST|nr:hypothetical protein UR08_11440 [Listeria kieliensis]
MVIKKIPVGALFVLISIIAAVYPFIILLAIAIGLCIILADTLLKRITQFLFAIVAIAAIFGPYLSFPGMGGLFLFRIVLLLHFVLFLFEKKDWQFLKAIKVPLLAIGSWIGFSIVTLIWSQDLQLSLRAIYFQLESFYLIFLVVYYVRQMQDLKKLLYWIIPPFLLSIGVGCYEMFTGNHLWYSSLAGKGYPDYRPTGLLTNTNDFSSYLSIYFPLFIYLLFQKNMWWRWLIALSSMGILFFLVVASESRTGLLAFGIMLLLLIIKLFSKLISGILLFIGINLVSIFLLVMQLIGKQEFGYLVGKETSTDQRLLIYETGLNVAKESHFLGVGIGVVPNYIFQALYGTVNIPDDMQQTMSAHNFWLATLADVGILGLCCVLFFFIWLLVYACRQFVNEKGLLTGTSLSILIAFVAISIGSSSIFEMRVVWLGVGIALAIVHLNLRKKEEKI